MKVLGPTIVLAATLVSVPACAQVVSGSQWVNDVGSVLTIKTVNANGRFEGEFVSNAAGLGCQKAAYPVVGWTNDKAIGWTVSWKNASEDCRSVTSWSGVILSPGVIEVIWSLGYTNKSYGPRVLTGSDYFSKK